MGSRVRVPGLLICVAILATVSAGALATEPPAAPPRETPYPLAPHEALYDLTLSRAEPGGVVSAKGQMAYTIRNACSGWSIESRTDLHVGYIEGGDVSVRWEYSAFESFDGREYAFFIRNSQDGEEIEVLEGSASLDQPIVSAGATKHAGNAPAGSARYRLPPMGSVALPKGTLFPNSHTLALLRAAKRGEPFLGRELFDGGTPEGPSLVTAAIGPTISPREPSQVKNPLLETPSWRMAIAFFSPLTDADSAEMPSYQVSARYHENGIAQEMRQDFGAFTLTTRLKSLKPIEAPDCGR